jgi:hypothetical protein
MKRRSYNPQYARPVTSRRDRLDDAIARDTAAWRRPNPQAAAPSAGAEPKTETKNTGDE